MGRTAQGRAELAKMVVALGEKRTSFPTCNDDHDTLWDKMKQDRKEGVSRLRSDG